MHLSEHFRDVYLSGAISGIKLLSKQPEVLWSSYKIVNQEEKIDLTAEEKEKDLILSLHVMKHGIILCRWVPEGPEVLKIWVKNSRGFDNNITNSIINDL